LISKGKRQRKKL